MSGTILLADDSLTIQKVVELTFADTNYRVVAVSSGDDLLDRLGDSQPDLIICDVIMPGKDGYEVCQQIKSSSQWLHLPVILLTGTFEPFDRDRAIAAGCSEIITKPFEARKLVDTVERLIGGPDIQTPQADDRGPSMSDDAEVWPEEATPVGVPSEIEAEEFRTQLSASKTEEDGIEFTTSGFAEMEAAGREPREIPAEPAPADGLEYEFGASDVNDMEETTPSAGPPPAPTDPSAQTVKIDVAAIQEEIAPLEDQESVADPAGADDGGTVDFDAPEPEPEISAEAVPEPFVPVDEEPFAAPVEAAPQDTIEDRFEDEPSMADTSPVEVPDEEEEPAVESAPDEAFRLSDDDIDRIARRVIELASDRLDQIAWEVVPDMAEIVVRQRIRELEDESEAANSDPVQ